MLPMSIQDTGLSLNPWKHRWRKRISKNLKQLSSLKVSFVCFFSLAKQPLSLSLSASSAVPTVQHVVHHHIRGHGHQTCPGYCELCCPWIEDSRPPPQRHSRRDHYERDELDRAEYSRGESLDERIERIRQELRYSPVHQRHQSTETVEHHVHHQRPRSRSSSSHRYGTLLFSSLSLYSPVSEQRHYPASPGVHPVRMTIHGVMLICLRIATPP